MSLISIDDVKTARRWKQHLCERGLREDAVTEPHPPWQAGLGRDALLQGWSSAQLGPGHWPRQMWELKELAGKILGALVPAGLALTLSPGF